MYHISVVRDRFYTVGVYSRTVPRLESDYGIMCK
jgi:hypothetical protein